MGVFRRGNLTVGAGSGASSQVEQVVLKQEINAVFPHDEGWTVVKRRKRKAPRALEKDNETKGIKKGEVATKKSNFCLRAPSQRTGKICPVFKVQM